MHLSKLFGTINPCLVASHFLILSRLAFADSQWFIADPEFSDVPIKQLLSKEYLASRAKLFNPERTNPRVIHVRGINPCAYDVQ